VPRPVLAPTDEHPITIAPTDGRVLVQVGGYCPYMGDASYSRVQVPGVAEVRDAIWTYQDPYPAVAAIAGHAAFYADRAEVTVGD
jgi:uncharacterized protein (DUF427 family)